MSEKEYKIEKEEKQINELAIDYYYARIDGNKSKTTRLFNDIYRLIYAKGTSPYKKAFKKIYEKNLIEDFDSIVADALLDALPKYEYMKTDGDLQENKYLFFPMFMKWLNFKCLDRIDEKKRWGEYGYIEIGKGSDDKPLPNNGPKENIIPIDSLDDIEKNVEASSYEELIEKTERNLSRITVRERLPFVVLSFYEHNKGKSASEKRLSYFKIFVTETMIDIITESRNIDHFNKNEAYECSDRDYVRFISYSKYENLEDLLRLKFKRFSDVIEDYSGEDRVLEVPCENKVIIEYRFKNGLDEERTSEPNVTQQKNKYKKQLALLFNDYASCQH